MYAYTRGLSIGDVTSAHVFSKSAVKPVIHGSKDVDPGTLQWGLNVVLDMPAIDADIECQSNESTVLCCARGIARLSGLERFLQILRHGGD